MSYVSGSEQVMVDVYEQGKGSGSGSGLFVSLHEA